MFFIIRFALRLFIFLFIVLFILNLMHQNTKTVLEFIREQKSLFDAYDLTLIYKDAFFYLNDSDIFRYFEALDLQDIFLILFLRLYIIVKLLYIDFIFIFLLSLVFFIHLSKKFALINTSFMRLNLVYSISLKFLFILILSLYVQTYILNDIYLIVSLMSFITLIAFKISINYFQRG